MSLCICLSTGFAMVSSRHLAVFVGGCSYAAVEEICRNGENLDI